VRKEGLVSLERPVLSWVYESGELEVPGGLESRHVPVALSNLGAQTANVTFDVLPEDGPWNGQRPKLVHPGPREPVALAPMQAQGVVVEIPALEDEQTYRARVVARCHEIAIPSKHIITLKSVPRPAPSLVILGAPSLDIEVPPLGPLLEQYDPEDIKTAGFEGASIRLTITRDDGTAMRPLQIAKAEGLPGIQLRLHDAAAEPKEGAREVSLGIPGLPPQARDVNEVTVTIAETSKDEKTLVASCEVKLVIHMKAASMPVIHWLDQPAHRGLVFELPRALLAGSEVRLPLEVSIHGAGTAAYGLTWSSRHSPHGAVVTGEGFDQPPGRRSRSEPAPGSLAPGNVRRLQVTRDAPSRCVLSFRAQDAPLATTQKTYDVKDWELPRIDIAVTPADGYGKTSRTLTFKAPYLPHLRPAPLAARIRAFVADLGFCSLFLLGVLALALPLLMPIEETLAIVGLSVRSAAVTAGLSAGSAETLPLGVWTAIGSGLLGLVMIALWRCIVGSGGLRPSPGKTWMRLQVRCASTGAICGRWQLIKRGALQAVMLPWVVIWWLAGGWRRCRTERDLLRYEALTDTMVCQLVDAGPPEAGKSRRRRS
jgi:hypothetical protein